MRNLDSEKGLFLGGGNLCDQTAQISLSSCLIFVVPRRRADAPAAQSRARPPDPTHPGLDNFESTLQISTPRFHTGVLFPPSFHHYFLSSPARTDFPISGISDVFPFADVQMFPPQFSRGPPPPPPDHGAGSGYGGAVTQHLPVLCQLLAQGPHGSVNSNPPHFSGLK